MMHMLFRRDDGSFVIELNGMPYHVVEGDEPHWSAAKAEAESLGQDLPFEPPPPPPAVNDPEPLTISDRQFAQGLAGLGIISETEAEEWVGPGTVPAVLLGFVDELPQAQRFAARMLLRGATQFERAHPLTEAFAAMHGWSPEQTDQFWRDCAAL